MHGVHSTRWNSQYSVTLKNQLRSLGTVASKTALSAWCVTNTVYAVTVSDGFDIVSCTGKTHHRPQRPARSFPSWSGRYAIRESKLTASNHS